MTTLSEIKGIPLSEEPGLGSLTLAGFVTEQAEKHGQRQALSWRDLSGVDRRWSYAELHEESRKVAKALLAVGVGKDTRVGVLISNRPEWLFSLFGTAMAGGVVVALNTFSTQAELKYQLMVSDVEVVILEAAVASKNFVEDIFAICPELAATAPDELMMTELPFLRRAVCIDKGFARQGLQDWDEFLALGQGVPDAIVDTIVASINPVDHGLIFFSSGSTALPKAIQATHRAAVLQCWRFGKWFEIDQEVRTWSANGFFFSGNFAMTFGTLSVGGCIVLQRYFNPDEAVEIIARERVSQILAWPHQEARLVECPGWNPADLSAVQYINKNSAMAAHPSIDTDWLQPNGYGLTETFTFVTGIAASENLHGSHGIVLPGNTLRIVDPDTGKILPMGETGEIIVKGPTLMPGYLKVPPENTFDGEGFIHTADAGHLSADGHLYWIGRLGDIIKTGGANVSPLEIDAVLVQHPAIQSVFTVGVPHDTLGEIVVSCVILREGCLLSEEELRAFAKQTLASYKVPRRVLFFTEEELPTTGSNKIRRSELRSITAQRMVE